MTPAEPTDPAEHEPCEHAGTAVAYALYAAEPEDEHRLLEHLADCEVCPRVLRDTYAVAAELALAVPAQDPPDHLRERLVAAVAAEPVPPREAPAAALEPPAPDPPAPPTVPTPPTASAPTAPAPPTPQRRSPMRLVVAAVVLGMALLAGRVLLGGGDSADPGTPVPSSAPGDAVALAQRADQVIGDAEASDPGVRHAVLRAPDGRPVAVVLDRAGSGPGERLVPLALAPPPPGRSWVLWGVEGRAARPPAPLGVVDASTGVPSATGERPPQGGWRAYAVSVEPGTVAPPRPSSVVAIGTVT